MFYYDEIQIIFHFILFSRALYLFYFADCSFKACGICEEGAKCGSYSCNQMTNPKWYCEGCGSGKIISCTSCKDKRCQRNECIRTCASCADSFCYSTYDYLNCAKENLKSCSECLRSFCNKDSCTNVTACTSYYCNYGIEAESYCEDCNGNEKLIACSNCKDLRCPRNECIRTCASCDDAFCYSTSNYDRPCAEDNLESCGVCLRSFCDKDSCTNVTICSESRCDMIVCEECVAAGTTKKMIHCSCDEHHCDTLGCRTKHAWRCSRFF
jgi:hypothetical protein